VIAPLRRVLQRRALRIARSGDGTLRRIGLLAVFFRSAIAALRLTLILLLHVALLDDMTLFPVDIPTVDDLADENSNRRSTTRRP
jgi:hypothetical protein